MFKSIDGAMPGFVSYQTRGHGVETLDRQANTLILLSK